MARPRVYRHDVRCPECGSNRMPKDDKSHGRPVYHCGECGRRTIPDATYQRPGAADKERALAMYQEGSSLSAIARSFGVSVPAVSRWVKKGGAPPCPGSAGAAQSAPSAVVIACAALWTYRQARRKGKWQDLWVWTAVVVEPAVGRWAGFEIGDRSEKTFLRLYERLPAGALYCTDACQVYGWLPADRHRVGKGGAVNWNEGLHSWCRGKLNGCTGGRKGTRKAWKCWRACCPCCWCTGPQKPYASLC